MIKNKKAILLISHELDIHGASKMLIQIIESLQEEYDIHVLVPGSGKINQILDKKKCHVISKKFYLDVEPKSDKAWNKVIWYIRVIRYYLFRKRINNKVINEVSKYVVENNIVLVHSNSSSISIGLDIAKKNRIKHVWHFREFLAEDFNLHPLIGWENYLKKASQSEAIICVSKSIYQKYANIINAPIYLIYDGIKDKNIEIKKKNHNGLNLFQAGVLSIGKGTDIAVKAVNKLINEGYNIHLYLAGNGNLDFCQDIYDSVKSHIHLLGFVDDIDYIKNKLEIDIELVCSKSEGFGLVTVEAMRSHNPVIGSNSAGTSELIKDGYNGYLFDLGSVDDLVKKINIFREYPEKIEIMGENGYKRFKELFTSDRNIYEIKKIYRNMLEDNRRGK